MIAASSSASARFNLFRSPARRAQHERVRSPIHRHLTSKPRRGGRHARRRPPPRFALRAQCRERDRPEPATMRRGEEAPVGVVFKSATIVCGRPTPTLFQVPPASPDAKTPTSSATTRCVPTIATSFAGASTRSPLMSCQQLPPSVVSKTWPTPGSSGHHPVAGVPRHRDVRMPLVDRVDGDTGDVAVGHRVATAGNGLEVELVPAAPEVRDQSAVEAGLGHVARPARPAPGRVALTAREPIADDRVSRLRCRTPLDQSPAIVVEALRRLPRNSPPP